MALQRDQIPNKALNGKEVLEIAVAETRAMLERDCMMLPTIAYRKVAMTIAITFHLGHPHQPHVVKSKVREQADGMVSGEVPLNPIPEEVDGEPQDIVVALERDVALDNPNLARVHHDLPIKTQERKPPRPLAVESVIPGEPPAMLTDPFPDFENRELRYDKTQFPEGPTPVDRDVSEKKAEEFGIKPRGRLGLKDRSSPSK